MNRLTVSTTLVTEECFSCGMLFAMTEDFRRRRVADKRTWYCPQGHAQHYLGESDSDRIKRLEREVANASEDARIANAAAQRAKREATKLRQAREQTVKGGVCPHPDCHRSFVQLARHIKAKHPEYLA